MGVANISSACVSLTKQSFAKTCQGNPCFVVVNARLLFPGKPRVFGKLNPQTLDFAKVKNIPSVGWMDIYRQGRGHVLGSWAKVCCTRGDLCTMTTAHFPAWVRNLVALTSIGDRDVSFFPPWPDQREVRVSSW